MKQSVLWNAVVLLVCGLLFVILGGQSRDCTDSDGDGYAIEGDTCGNPCGPIDCDNSNPDINPGMSEGLEGDPACSGGVDNDCDGAADGTDAPCEGALPDSPCFWVGAWQIGSQNPVMWPSDSPPQGADNIYAPDILHVGDEYRMYYGGQGDDGHDQIFLAFSDDLVTWRKHPSHAAPEAVVTCGSSNHVNDPSVVVVAGVYYMFYTEAPNLEVDRIYLATSSDGIDWTKQGMVLDAGPPGSWDSFKVSRPSVSYEEDNFRMWYDGQDSSPHRHVGYATSPDGLHWTRHPSNPLIPHEGAVDVKRVGELNVLLAESQTGTRLYVSRNLLEWTYLGYILERSGEPWDAYGHVTPFLLLEADDSVSLFFGGASHECWCHNRIAYAVMGEDIPGCHGCLPEGRDSCQDACEVAGFSGSACGVPGSTNPDECCACWDEPHQCFLSII